MDNTINLPPRPDALIESMRDIGYSLDTAVADIVDNSITAKANKINIRFSWNNGDPWLAIIDNGIGMSEQKLIESMRFGSTNPLEKRMRDDLGRFGLGLKTASFSQCRKLTVLTKENNSLSCAQWDLDSISDSISNKWTLNLLNESDVDSIKFLSLLNQEYLEELESGTIVFWENLDKLGQEGSTITRERMFNETVNDSKYHLELVFHRFLSPKSGRTKLNIHFNKNELEAFDPFNTANSTELRSEEFMYDNSRISVQPYVLPHHNKVSKAEWKKYSGKKGYLQEQGFYVYRNRRLIIYGTWFRLLGKKELTKLIRVKVDIPNSLDHLWRIDIKKSNAFPPSSIREGLKRILSKIEYSGKRVYQQRGQRLSNKVSTPGWIRIAKENQIFYEVNKEHPLIIKFFERNDDYNGEMLDSILTMLETSFPRDSFFNDLATNPESVSSRILNKEKIETLLEYFIDAENASPDKNYLNQLLQMDPFSINKKVAESIFKERGYVY